MNPHDTMYLAESIATQRTARIEAEMRMARLRAEAGVDHPLRRTLSHALMSIAARMSPTPLEPMPSANAARPC